jgi:ATP diphosphatase
VYVPFKPSNPPDLQQAGQQFQEFCNTIAMLRDPKLGCPWDLKQTHETLIPYAIEETYEVVQAIRDGDATDLQEELGDLLLQIVLHGQLAQDAQEFSIVDIIRSINAKMRRRHPHVFDRDLSGPSSTEEEIKKRWKEIKSEEKSLGAKRKGTEAPKGIFAGLEKVFPPSQRALEIGKIAKKIAFDWSEPKQVLQALRAEIDELEQAMNEQGTLLPPALARTANQGAIQEELGDVYFTVAQLTRHLGLHPEAQMDLGNRKFLARFAKVEELLKQDGLTPESAGQELLETYWQKAKMR